MSLSKPKKPRIYDDSARKDFSQAPIIKLPRQQCRPGLMQRVFKEYSEVIKAFPMVVFRICGKQLSLTEPGFKNLDAIVTVLTKSVEGFKNRPISGLFLVKEDGKDGKQLMKLERYLDICKEKGTITCEEFLKKLHEGGYDQQYTEHLDNPDDFVERAGPILWNLEKECGLNKKTKYQGINTCNLYIGKNISIIFYNFFTYMCLI